MLTSNKTMILSDQYDNWSDRFTESINPIPSKPTSGPRAPAAAAQFSAPRIFDRAVQALWQTRLQMRPGTRTRTQVLLVDQPTGRPTRHGLRPTRFARDCRPLSGKLSFGSRDLGSNLQHQPRTAASQKAPIEKQRVPGEPAKPHSTNRSPPRRYSDCQHGRGLFTNRAVGNLFRGDQK
jgi:hypothetical protein